MDKTTLGDRMKMYESAYETYIMPRAPVIIRCDGKSFHTFTRKFDKPFDEKFNRVMANTMFYVANKIDGCVFSYAQSDEITFVIRNDKTFETEPWFGNRLQKMCSVVSSMITAQFAHEGKYDSLAYFDTRVFAVPSLTEAGNALVWRQNDCVKNSISSACYYEIGKKIGKGTARKKMYKLNQKQQQELLFSEAGINWSSYPTKYKRGVGCYREKSNLMANRGWVWKFDEELPKFTAEGKFDWLINTLNVGFDNE